MIAMSVNSDVRISMLQEYSLITSIAIQWLFCEDIMPRVIKSIPPDEKANSIILQLGDKRKTTYAALLRASHTEWHSCSRRRNVDTINWKRTYFILVELDRAGLGLALGLRLLSVLVLPGGVAPLARGGCGYRARLRPRGDRRRRWCRRWCYRDVGQGAQTGCRWAQGHRARRRRQW